MPQSEPVEQALPTAATVLCAVATSLHSPLVDGKRHGAKQTQPAHKTLGVGRKGSRFPVRSAQRANTLRHLVVPSAHLSIRQSTHTPGASRVASTIGAYAGRKHVKEANVTIEGLIADHGTMARTGKAIGSCSRFHRTS
jgi:hypothetical protein